MDVGALPKVPETGGKASGGDEGGGNARRAPRAPPISIAAESLRNRERALDAQSHIRVRNDCMAHPSPYAASRRRAPKRIAARSTSTDPTARSKRASVAPCGSSPNTAA